MNSSSPGQGYLAERRQYRRFLVEVGSFFVKHPKTEQAWGHLIDISQYGLSFVYFSESVKEITAAETIDIVRPNREICVEALHYRNVTDFEVENGYPSFNSQRRRRGVELIRLTHHQLRNLVKLIQDECTGAPFR